MTRRRSPDPGVDLALKLRKTTEQRGGMVALLRELLADPGWTKRAHVTLKRLFARHGVSVPKGE